LIPHNDVGHNGQHILIVEDDPMLAFGIEQLLLEHGFRIAGMASNLETALTMIESGVYDAAILDANLAGTSAVPAAVALRARGVPFIVLSGYSKSQLNEAFLGATLLQKPCKPELIMQTLRGLLPAQ
jgi:DNA-binding response OmpR family regulator